MTLFQDGISMLTTLYEASVNRYDWMTIQNERDDALYNSANAILDDVETSNKKWNILMWKGQMESLSIVTGNDMAWSDVTFYGAPVDMSDHALIQHISEIHNESIRNARISMTAIILWFATHGMVNKVPAALRCIISPLPSMIQEEVFSVARVTLVANIVQAISEQDRTKTQEHVPSAWSAPLMASRALELCRNDDRTLNIQRKVSASLRGAESSGVMPDWNR